MSILPLPVFEADADPHHRSALTEEEQYQQLEPPKTIVVRYGAMKLIGEFRYDGDIRPGCGTKLVAVESVPHGIRAIAHFALQSKAKPTVAETPTTAL